MKDKKDSIPAWRLEQQRKLKDRPDHQLVRGPRFGNNRKWQAKQKSTKFTGKLKICGDDLSTREDLRENY